MHEVILFVIFYFFAVTSSYCQVVRKYDNWKKKKMPNDHSPYFKENILANTFDCGIGYEEISRSGNSLKAFSVGKN